MARAKKEEKEQKEILESIRDIIGNEKGAEGEEEILDLTELATPSPIQDNIATKPANLFEEDLTADINANNDILTELDSLLESGEPVKSITTPDAEIELAGIAPKPAPEPELIQEPEFVPEIAPQETVGETEMNEHITEAEPLISEESAAKTEAALKTLVKTVNTVTHPKIQSTAFKNGDTVEDIVAEMLKPLLKDWLDANLPVLVQNIVEKEIKRLIPNE